MEFHSAVSYIKTHCHLIALASGLMEYSVLHSFVWRPMAGNYLTFRVLWSTTNRHPMLRELLKCAREYAGRDALLQRTLGHDTPALLVQSRELARVPFWRQWLPISLVSMVREQFL